MAQSEPIFKSIFGESWDALPPVMKKHYANRAFSDDVVTVKGHLDVMCKWYLKPIFSLFKTIPPYNKSKVPVSVYFKSEQTSEAFCFDRFFYFKPEKPFHFRSKMFQVKSNEVMELMNYGMCWHSIYSWDGSNVILKHKSYSFRFYKFNIPLPITWILGAGNATETPIDDYNFSMCATIDHWLFGKVYEYKGSFKFTKVI